MRRIVMCLAVLLAVWLVMADSASPAEIVKRAVRMESAGSKVRRRAANVHLAASCWKVTCPVLVKLPPTCTPVPGAV